MAHAKLSPSASSRWLACPGSIGLTANIKSKSGSAAMLGTTIHQAGENILNGEHCEPGISITFDPEYNLPMQWLNESGYEEAKAYANYVQAICKKDKDHELLVEMKVDISQIYPKGYDIGDETITGSADAVVVENGNLHIIDLKTGAGLVSAEENSQLKIYAYGAYEELSVFHDIDNIILHIVQNNERTGGDRTNSWETTPDKIIDWIEKEVKPKAEEALSDNARCIPGESQCRWCDAVSFCEAANAHAETIIDDIFDDLQDHLDEGASEKEVITNSANIVSMDKVIKFIEGFKFLENLSKAYEERMFDEMSKGNEVPGYKLVKKQTRKKWSDEIAAFEKLKTWTKLDDIAPRKLVTPNQAEKLLGKMSTKKQNVFNELWTRPEGELIVAPTSDKRPAEKPVVESFDDLDDEL